jgi:hypothetical protein
MQRLRGLADPERWRPFMTRRYCTLYAGVLTLLVSGTLYGLSAYTPALKGPATFLYLFFIYSFITIFKLKYYLNWPNKARHSLVGSTDQLHFSQGEITLIATFGNIGLYVPRSRLLSDIKMRSLTYAASPHTQICWVSDGQALRHAGGQVDLRSGGRHGLRRLFLCLGSTHTTLRTHAPPHHAHSLSWAWSDRRGRSHRCRVLVAHGHLLPHHRPRQLGCAQLQSHSWYFF